MTDYENKKDLTMDVLRQQFDAMVNAPAPGQMSKPQQPAGEDFIGDYRNLVGKD